MQFVDAMLAELGLDGRRKAARGQGWAAEFFDSYLPADYRGLVDEWMRLRGLVPSANKRD